MARKNIAVLISLFSVLVASISLGWNIYRDLLLRPRARVNFGLYDLAHSTLDKPIPFFILSVTNLGPGKLRLLSIFVRDFSFSRWLTRRVKFAHITPDYKASIGGRLPADLEVGQEIQLAFTPDNCEFLNKEYTHIGVSSSFGKALWCRREEMREAVKQFSNREWLSSGVTILK